MIKVGWARRDSTFRRVFTSLMIPGATEEQAGWLDALQRHGDVRRERDRRPGAGVVATTSAICSPEVDGTDAGAARAPVTG